MKLFTRLQDFYIKLAGRKTIVVCLLILNILSLVAIYSSSHQDGEFVNPDILHKQIAWIGISWLLLGLFLLINYRIYYDLSYLFYAINLLLLLAVFIFGKTAMGAQRWISIFGITFQPSELSKITTIFVLARLFSRANSYSF